MSQRHHTTQSPARPRLSPRALGSLLLLLALLGACSRRVNTASSRTWQAFVTRYNVLYNAREAYQTTYQTALDGTTDDYTLRLPIDPVLARATTPGAAPRFSRTIEKATKAIEEHSISRKPTRPAHWRQDPRAVRMQEKTEYNPALAEAWLLIARSQLYGGDLPAAHTTLTDILRRYATEPEVGDVARLYLCRLYTLRGELFDAEEELQHATRREGEVLRHTPLLYHTAAAELALARGEDSTALTHLTALSRSEKSALQRARLSFLIGQILEAQGAREAAKVAFARAERTSPQPALELAAQLRTLALSAESGTGIHRLQRLARLRRYAPHRSAIYLALAEALLASDQREAARTALRQSIDSAQTLRGSAAEAYTRLGLLELEDQHYVEAAEALEKAFPFLQRQHPHYATVELLLPGLRLLTPHARTAYRADSLLRLAALPTDQLERHIDSLIAHAEATGEKVHDPSDAVRSPFDEPTTTPRSTSAGFYFDDPQQIALGRIAFRQRWGSRPLTDDWNRSLRALDAAPVAPTTTEEAGASDATSPDRGRSREAYLRDLPLTPKAREALTDTLASALFRMASVLDDPLQRLDEVGALYTRLLRDFPHFAEREEVAYRQILLALRQGRDAEAEGLRREYLRLFPNSPRAKLLHSPELRHSLQRLANRSTELYDAAYEAYRTGDISHTREYLTELDALPYHDEDLRPKALLLTALTEVQAGQEAQLRKRLEDFVQRYPETPLMPYASSLLAALHAGRTLTTPPLLTRAVTGSTEGVSETEGPATTFSPTAAGEVVSLVLLYPEGSLPRHEVYFALMSFAYSHFTQWTLQVSPLPTETGLKGYLIEGFPTASDLKTFRERATSATGLLPALPEGSLLLPLSAANRPLLTRETLADYRAFLGE